MKREMLSITQKLKLAEGQRGKETHDRRNGSSSDFSFTAGPDIGRQNSTEIPANSSNKRIRDITRRAEGVSMKTTMEELGSLYAGLARLLRLLPNGRGVGSLSLAGSGCDCGPLCGVSGKHHVAALIALDVFGQLSNTADSSRGPWSIARSKAL